MVFKPDDKRVVYWEFFVLLATIICTFIIPIIVVFKIPRSPGLIAFDIVITLIFAVDIFVHFHLAYVDQMVLVTDKKKIAKRYLSRWFLPDLLATLPLGLLFAGVKTAALSRLFRIFRLTRLFKLITSSKTLRRFNNISDALNPSVIRLILMIFWIFVISHLMSCGWIAIGGAETQDTIWETYLRSIYWTITTVTTIGYGDITPVTNGQILFVIFIELLGAGMYGFIIGNIANLLANLDIAKSQHMEKVERINTFLKYKDISHPLQKRVNNYYEYMWETRRGYNEASVISELPLSLKTQVAIEMNRELIEQVPLFKGASEAFLKDIILNLEPVIFTPGDYIITAGEIGYEMYFITRGSVEVLSADESMTFATVPAGSFIGEIALLLSTPRTATVKALDYCDLYMLHKDVFDRILAKYPEIAKSIETMAKERKKKVEEAKKK